MYWCLTINFFGSQINILVGARFPERYKRDDRPETYYNLLFQVELAIEEQFVTGRVLASISSRPGQCGRSDGYILEGKELEFYMKKIKAKKGR